MSQVIRGIDFEVQGGNPGAIALYFHGAQGCSVQATPYFTMRYLLLQRAILTHLYSLLTAYH